MFFRFAAALFLVVLISMVGIGLEKQTLEMKRAVSRQYFQKDLLLELHAKQRLRIQQLTAPSQLAELTDFQRRAVDGVHWSSNAAAKARTAKAYSERDPRRPKLPLLRWEHPARNAK